MLCLTPTLSSCPGKTISPCNAPQPVRINKANTGSIFIIYSPIIFLVSKTIALVRIVIESCSSLIALIRSVLKSVF
uniref:Uncharacterized protein n=1 Tax=uncultured marine virus TaxID=186617 RepID=A0A0F7L0L7_9VIRU|nr:hypothetical protein [uncultured marine virus]